jgi:hypothetical protein
MARGGNRYENYAERRRLSGRLALPDQHAENALHFLAEGVALGDIPKVMEGQITVEQIDALLSTSVGQRRLTFLKQQEDRERQPESPDECLKFVKNHLIGIAKDAADEKTRITALKALADVAIDERKNRPAGTGVQAEGSALDELTKLRGSAK